MRKKLFMISVFAALLAASVPVSAANVLELRPQYQDFFQEVKYMEPVPGIDLALEWARPAALKEDDIRKISPYLLPPPQAETPVMMNSFEFYSSAVLTENDLGGGSFLTIKAAGAGDSFSYIVDPQTVVELKYHQFDIKTTGPGVNDTDDFSLKSFGVRRTQSIPFIEKYLKDATLIGEYRLISNKVDKANYLAGTASRSMSDKMTGTLGLEFVDSGTGGRDMGIVAGARYCMTPELQAFAVYNGADPMKFVYNHHMIKAVSGVGSIYCVDCAPESVNAGLTYKLGSNLALNLFGFDMTDMGVTSGSLSYVVKQ